ncbi:hypothetical protein GCM10009747_16670 [Agromyces humatus]|uniref:Twin-arginine translocation signal domain-containing protein n=1 Tax=Agromyces humatus TaxID=279573 RepID=A0ABN2KKL7_9MICO
MGSEARRGFIGLSVGAAADCGLRAARNGAGVRRPGCGCLPPTGTRTSVVSAALNPDCADRVRVRCPAILTLAEAAMIARPPNG